MGRRLVNVGNASSAATLCVLDQRHATSDRGSPERRATGCRQRSCCRVAAAEDDGDECVAAAVVVAAAAVGAGAAAEAEGEPWPRWPHSGLTCRSRGWTRLGPR